MPLLSRDKVTRLKINGYKGVQYMKIISECDNFINTQMTYDEYAEWLKKNSNLDITLK